MLKRRKLYFIQQIFFIKKKKLDIKMFKDNDNDSNIHLKTIYKRMIFNVFRADHSCPEYYLITFV